MTEDQRMLCEDIAQRSLCSLDGILYGASKDPQHVFARREMARALRAQGLSTTQIGRCLRRDHSTIVKLLNRDGREVKGMADLTNTNVIAARIGRLESENSKLRKEAKFWRDKWLKSGERTPEASTTVGFGA